MRRRTNNTVFHPRAKPPSASRKPGHLIGQAKRLPFGFILALSLLCLAFITSLYHSPKPSIPMVAPVAFGAPQMWNATLAAPLSASDIATYREILAAQKKADWAKADQLIATLQDPILVSSLMADRYLHRQYESQPKKLSAWLDSHAQHPQAQAIARLIRSKDRTLYNDAPDTADTTFSARVIDDGKGSVLRDSGSVRTDATAIGQKVANKVVITLDTQSPEAALRMVNAAKANRSISAESAASLKGRIGQYLFNRAQYGRAYPLFQEAASVANPAPSHVWMAGISAYHLKQYRTAARQFSRLSKLSIPVGDKAAAYYWSYLSHKASGNSSAAEIALAQAKQYPRSFYGILALKASGETLTVSKAPSDRLDDLVADAAVHRAASWMALGLRDRAEEELRTLFANADSDKRRVYVQLASLWSMPTLQMRMGHALRAEGEHLDFALYPTPGWKPHTGYSVDPALLYAIARQESKFEQNVTSPAGARGVMQLMPNTARYVAGDAGLKKEAVRGKLSEPVTNVTLGQQYVQYLMEKPYIRNNLVFITAAYNAGPGKVAEWQGRIDDRGDPLLFIESLSFSETRNYVQQVMANYWIYSALMGTQAPSLDALASNEWPLYEVNNLEFAGFFDQKLN